MRTHQDRTDIYQGVKIANESSKLPGHEQRMKEHEERVRWENERNEHHVWCNYFMKSAKDCPMCKGLNEKYPIGNLTLDELINKHFSNIVTR